MTAAPDLEKGPYGSTSEGQSSSAVSAERVSTTPNAVTENDGQPAEPGAPNAASETAKALEMLKDRKRAIVRALVGDAEVASNDLSEHLHRLYRLNIRYHRMSLIKDSVQLYSMDKYVEGQKYRYIQDSDMKALEVDLQRHSQALKDYQTFRDLAEGEFLEDATLGERAAVAAALDDFAAPGPHCPEDEAARRKALVERQRKGLLIGLSEIGEAGDAGSDNLLQDMQANKEKQMHDRKFVAFMARLTMALFGGFALIVPMLIMDLHPTKLTSLLTTSVFVLAVAVCFAAATDWESKDIIGATAAFAGVLVVFVGTTTPGGNLSDGKIAWIVTGVVCGLYFVVLAVAFVIAGPNIRAATLNAARTNFWRIWHRALPLKPQYTQKGASKIDQIPIDGR